MAGKKLIQLTGGQAVSLSNEDRIYFEDTSATTGLQSKWISKGDLQNTLNLSPIQGSNRLISGGMVWVSGLIFESINLVYEIGSEQFAITDGTQVTLDAADPTNPRFDLIYGDDLGALGKSTGTPAGSPTANTLPSYQFQLKLVSILATATTPDGVSKRTVYVEDAGQTGEFDATESTSAVRIDLANTTTPLTGTKDIKTISALSNADTITFTHATATTLAVFDNIIFDIKCLANWGNDYIEIQLYDSAVLVGTAFLDSNILDVTDVTNTQSITIFKSQFSFVNGQTEFDVIKFYNRVRGTSAILYQLDEIYLFEDANGTLPVILTATDIGVDTTSFAGNLSTADTNVQLALDTIDDLSLGTGTLDNIVEDTTPQLGGDLDSQENTVYFTESYLTGDGAGELSIDLSILSNKHRIYLDENITTTVFLNPPGPSNHVFVIEQGTGNNTIWWQDGGTRPLRWPAGTTGILSTGAGDIDVLTLYYDGSGDYNAMLAVGFE